MTAGACPADTRRGSRGRRSWQSLLKALALSGLLVLAGVGNATPGRAVEGSAKPATQGQDKHEPAQSEDPEATRASLLQEGVELVRQQRHEDAIRIAFDPLIAAYQAQYAGSNARIYSSRSLVETLMYLVPATSATDKGEPGQGQNALVTPTTTWAEAYFNKAYALVELGRLADARSALEQALHLSPNNSRYMTEFGSIYQGERDWPGMLATCEQGAEAARSFSPPALRTDELTRALRCQGYALVELGQLKQAEEVYRKSLKENRNDQRSRDELEYLRQLQEKTR